MARSPREIIPPGKLVAIPDCWGVGLTGFDRDGGNRKQTHEGVAVGRLSKSGVPLPILTSDGLTLMRLMADVAALKTDPVVQRQTLVDGLQKLFKTKIGWLLVADNYRPGRQVVMVHQVLTSDVAPDWVRYIGDFAVNHPIESDVYGDHSLHATDEMFVLKRRELLPDAAAEQKYAACMEVIRLLKVGDAAIGCYRTGPGLDRIVGFSMHRDEAAPDFTEAEHALIRLAIEEVRDLEARGHIEYRPVAEAELTPRLGQVLDRVLSGKSAKMIAYELNLSIHTVREHMQRLYQRYGVSTREELTAKFLK